MFSFFSDAQSCRLNALTTVRNFTQKYKTSVAKGAKCLVPAFDLVLTAGIDEKGREGSAAQTRLPLSWSLDRKGRIDSPSRLPQRRVEVHREGAALARPGRTGLRLGHLYHHADFAGRSVCLRASLAPPGKRRRNHPHPLGLHRSDGARTPARGHTSQ